MFDPSIGRWLEMDPIAFDAGDANLYRFGGNDPTNVTDSSGLLAFAIQGANLVMKVQVKLTWDMPEKWTPARQMAVQQAIKEQIEKTWSNNPFVIRAAGDNQNASPQDKAGYKPTVAITFVLALQNKDDGWEIIVEPGDHEKGHVTDNQMTISERNVLKGQDGMFTPPGGQPIPLHQSTPAHEFGHLLGEDHPGFYVPKEIRGPNKESEYTVDRFALMGEGEGLRGTYFTKWIRYLKERDLEEKKNRGVWIVTADKNHPLYQKTLDGYKFLQEESKRFLPPDYFETPVPKK